MTIQMNQIQGLGQAEIVAAILGPVVTAGADIYRTREESRFSKSELKQRGKEFAADSELRREQLRAAEIAQIMQQRAAMQSQALRGAWWQGNLPLIVGGSLLAVLAIAAVGGRRQKR